MNSTTFFARLLAVTFAVVPPVALTAFGVATNSNEGRPDSYVIGSIVVCIGCALVELVDITSRSRLVARFLWVPVMPLVAGASTGFALALLHPKRDGLAAVFGGAGIGIFGSVILFPMLIVAALLVQTWAYTCARQLRVIWPEPVPAVTPAADQPGGA